MGRWAKFVRSANRQLRHNCIDKPHRRAGKPCCFGGREASSSRVCTRTEAHHDNATILICFQLPSRDPALVARSRPASWSSTTLRCCGNLMSTVLQRRGFSVWTAADGVEAVATYRQHGPQIAVVLLDVRMPVLDGPATLVQLRQLNPALCCCFMSGHTGEYTLDDLLACARCVIVSTSPFAWTKSPRRFCNWRRRRDGVTSASIATGEGVVTA